MTGARDMKSQSPWYHLFMVEPKSGRICTFPDCGRKHYGKGLCNTHWQQMKDRGTLSPIRTYRENRARDEQGRKLCGDCGDWKAEQDFYKNVTSADGLVPVCKVCTCVRQVESRFNLGRGGYGNLLRAQGGVCAVCGGLNADGKSLAVDHDHECCPDKSGCPDCVRGLLCSPCNHAVGLMRDDPDRLRRAAAYLERAPQADCDRGGRSC